MKYRKKPVVIEAIQFHGNSYGTDADTAKWASAELTDNGDGRSSVMRIATLEGVMEAVRGDWIIKGVGGEFYPCKPHIFDATYEPA